MTLTIVEDFTLATLHFDWTWFSDADILLFVSKFSKTRIAHLLGVAGADIPVSDIKKLMQPFLVSLWNL